MPIIRMEVVGDQMEGIRKSKGRSKKGDHWSWADVAPPKILRCPPLHSLSAASRRNSVSTLLRTLASAAWPMFQDGTVKSLSLAAKAAPI